MAAEGIWNVGKSKQVETKHINALFLAPPEKRLQKSSTKSTKQQKQKAGQLKKPSKKPLNKFEACRVVQ